ncbi:precorrin-3B C(17)-methyltransferase [Oscillospiraceae bacterium MB08-C2-2]|nr:precorrin-3B C(17)-methyltransferase [Oscillospiraceae bacterium MB08-C2-2]
MNKLYVIGIGPGSPETMTPQAASALEQSELLCGYQGYIDLVRERYPEKPMLSTPMTKEVERCRAALEQAVAGKTVAMLCSGDPGVYGMAGLLLELSEQYPPVDIEVVPGVTAALSGAALLGAPLMHDFAVISLSDRMTLWADIEKRLRLAAQADFSLCLYNPSSRQRKDYLCRAVDILLELLPGETVCGWAKNIGREGCDSGVLTLAQLRDFPADMFTTVFVGKSTTRLIGGRMVTPRGYPVEQKGENP